LDRITGYIPGWGERSFHNLNLELDAEWWMVNTNYFDFGAGIMFSSGLDSWPHNRSVGIFPHIHH
jgi:hypothetical protein